jgi:hypothetical protein
VTLAVLQCLYTDTYILSEYFYSFLIGTLFYHKIVHHSWKPIYQIIIFLNSRNFV